MRYRSRCVAAGAAEHCRPFRHRPARDRKPAHRRYAVSVLRGGDEAYPSMLAAIRDARHSVALGSYIFRDDSVGRSFIAALIDAHKRGVEVRVLIDGIGSGYILSSPLRDLEAAGIPTPRFLHTWVPWRMPFLNMRNHKKLLIVDGTAGFTGGLNVGADHSRRRALKDYVDGVQADTIALLRSIQPQSRSKSVLVAASNLPGAARSVWERHIGLNGKGGPTDRPCC